MHFIKFFIGFILVFFSLSLPVHAKIIIASGAGYRSLVDDLTHAYTLETGKKVELIYGNMAQITAQAKNSGVVDLVLGDKSFLEKAGLGFSRVKPVGKGRLVMAAAKGKKFLGPDQLLSSGATRIALPDTQRAIYGKASLEYLHSKNLYDRVAPKLLMVATIPQAASYVIAGEVDFAFLNQTHARKIAKSIGSWVAVDESAYSPILIILGQMAGSSAATECGDFIQFLDSKKAGSIVADHGMQLD